MRCLYCRPQCQIKKLRGLNWGQNKKAPQSKIILSYNTKNAELNHVKCQKALMTTVLMHTNIYSNSIKTS